MYKTALITGASSGIGLELSMVFAANKINLLLVSRNENKLKLLAEELRNKNGIKVDILPKDLSNHHAVREVYDYCQMQNIKIDFLINNAGFGDYGMFIDGDWEKQMQMINLNITALTYLTKLFLPEMIKNKFGKIMNVASVAAFLPGPKMAVYFASKAYVLHFSEAVANEIEGTGVSMTILCPGATESGFMEAANMQESKMIKGKKLPSSKEVAIYGYNAMMKNKRIAFPEVSNYITANIIRLIPRNIMLKIARFFQDQ